MKLQLNLSENPFVFKLNNESGAICTIDSSQDIGGKNKGLTPMQLLAGALAGCISIDTLMILKKQKIEPKKYLVHIDALKRESVPSPFEKIHLLFSIDAGVDLTKATRAVQLSIDKYCSVKASLNPNICVSYEVIRI